MSAERESTPPAEGSASDEAKSASPAPAGSPAASPAPVKPAATTPVGAKPAETKPAKPGSTTLGAKPSTKNTDAALIPRRRSSFRDDDDRTLPGVGPVIISKDPLRPKTHVAKSDKGDKGDKADGAGGKPKDDAVTPQAASEEAAKPQSPSEEGAEPVEVAKPEEGAKSADTSKPDGAAKPDEVATGQEAAAAAPAAAAGVERSVDAAPLPKEPTKIEDETTQPRGVAAPDLTTDGIRITYFGRTDVGLVREHNEDNFTVIDLSADRPPVGGPGDSQTGRARRPSREVTLDAVQRTKVTGRGSVLAVCDGMGGAAAGEVASQMAVDTIDEFFSSLAEPRDRDHFARRIVSSVEEAGNRIFSAAKMDRTRRGMGTTATVAGLVDKVLFIGQVGDSRAYVLRAGELGLVTKDQSLVNQLIEAGQLTEEEAEAFEHSNIILQALGTTEEVSVDLTFLELRRGDRLMMCSDGLSGLVHPDMIKEVLETTPDLSECCDRLIEMANAGGGHDNITVLCAEFAGDDLPPPTPEDKPVYRQYPLPPASDEDRESLPPRDTRMKEGGKKPGADVKREVDEGRETTAEGARGREEPRSDRLLWMLVVAIIFAVVAAIVLAWRGGDGAEEEQSPIRDDDEAEAPIAEEEPMAQLRVTTDVDGELYVDGEIFGSLTRGEDIMLDLPPGVHRIEARSGGDLVAEEVVTLREGGDATVSLMMPSGTLEAPPPSPTVEESGGTTGGATGGAPPPAPIVPVPIEEVTPDPVPVQVPVPEPSMATTTAPRMTSSGTRPNRPAMSELPANPF